MLRMGGASAGIGMVLIVLTAWVGFATASAITRADTHDVVDKTVPQGEDPPGTNEDQQSPPPAQHKGVIPPPPMGDESQTPKLVMRRR